MCNVQCAEPFVASDRSRYKGTHPRRAVVGQVRSWGRCCVESTLSTILGKSYWPHGSTAGPSWVWHIVIDPILIQLHPQKCPKSKSSFWKKCIFCTVFDTALAFQPSWSHSSRNLPLLVSPPIAVIGPHICAGFTPVRAVPGGHHDDHDHDFWQLTGCQDIFRIVCWQSSPQLSPTSARQHQSSCTAPPVAILNKNVEKEFEQEIWSRSSATLFLPGNTGATVHCTV